MIVAVTDAEAARAAEAEGAEAIVARGSVDALREATELPILWAAPGPPSEAAVAGADACLVVVAHESEDGDRLERLHAEAIELGLDCVVVVGSEDDLDTALERLDPEIFLFSVGPEAEVDAVDRALELLPDVPAGKLAIAEVPVSSREQVIELERAGVDAVIVGARNVAELVGDAPPPV